MTLSATFADPGSSGDEFPLNRADPAYAETADGRFSCAYTGRHDHGELPPQRRDEGGHERTLRYIRWARGAAAAHLTGADAAEKRARLAPASS